MKKEDKEFIKFRRKMILWTSEYTADCWFRQKNNKDPLVTADISDIHRRLCRKIYNYLKK